MMAFVFGANLLALVPKVVLQTEMGPAYSPSLMTSRRKANIPGHLSAHAPFAAKIQYLELRARRHSLRAKFTGRE